MGRTGKWGTGTGSGPWLCKCARARRPVLHPDRGGASALPPLSPLHHSQHCQGVPRGQCHWVRGTRPPSGSSQAGRQQSLVLQHHHWLSLVVLTLDTVGNLVPRGDHTQDALCRLSPAQQVSCYNPPLAPGTLSEVSRGAGTPTLCPPQSSTLPSLQACS